MISNKRSYRQFINKRDLIEATAKIEPLSPPLESLGLYIAFSKAMPFELVDSFSAELKRLKQDNRVQEALTEMTLLCHQNTL
ncbi:MAG: hypothetical protein ACOH5I_09985 [Oligoflexus sp.]